MRWPCLDTIPLLLPLMNDGVSKDHLKLVAVNQGWILSDEDATSITFGIQDDSFLFVTENDPQYLDHLCLLQFLGAPDDVDSSERPSDLDNLFDSAIRVVARIRGAPANLGYWPSTEYDCFGFEYRYAIWRHGKGIVVLQQDDTDPQAGTDFNLCLQHWKSDEPLPTNRRWRYKA